MSIIKRASISFALFVVLAACDKPPTEPRVSTDAMLNVAASEIGVAKALLGGEIFRDKSLSLLRNQSCESCHDPLWGFTAPNPAINGAGAVMPGSIASRFGDRKPPSAAYATPSPVFFFSATKGYIGGNFWDGRATGARLASPSAEQALGPFVNPNEQALPDIACVVYRVSRSAYAGLYVATWGRSLFSIAFPLDTESQCEQEGGAVTLSAADRAQAMIEYDRIGLSIAAYEDSPGVNEFSSKYDAYFEGRAKLTAQEFEGLTLYAGKASCFRCHPHAGEKALFTDFTYNNIGVPPNPLNPAKLAKPAFRDLGLGGFLNTATFYGAQKVPTLRNIDKRGVLNGAKGYMHNGVLKSLEQVVHFYNTRRVLPDCATLSNPQFGVNCWPTPEVWETANVRVGNLGLTSTEEAAVVAFLRTLTDGFLPRR